MLIRTTAAAIVLAAPALAEEVTTYTLDNGMDVVMIEDHRAPAVVHMVWYRAGSADEPPGVSGVAHYLEHLMFKATDDLEAGEFSATVAINGGNDNAFTSYDYTAYYQRIAADRLPLMMEMEADRMTGLVLSERDAVTERSVIIEERNQRVENNAGALAQEQIAAAQYLNHRYGSPVIGWMHEMEALTQADAQAWYDLYYSPNNAILVVAGDVEPDEVLALAEEHYGPIPAEPDLPERFRPEEPPQRAERRVIFDDPRIAQPYVRRTYLAPERDAGAQEEAAALTYLAQILGGSSFTSVFAENLVFEDPVALFAGAFYDGTSLDDTTFSLSIAPLPGVTLPQAEAALDRVLAQFLEDGVDPEQMERIRTQIRASTIYAQDNVEGLARRYGTALTSGLTVEDVQAWSEILDAVTAEDVMAVARSVLDRDRAVTAYVLADRAVLTEEPPMAPAEEAAADDDPTEADAPATAAEQASETGSADETATPQPETAGEAGIVTDAEEETE